MNEKQRHIILCAYELFKEKGYLETSIQDILDASSISKATFYKYFQSKGGLTLGLLQEMQEKMNTELNLIILNYQREDEDALLRKIICFIKKFENEHALRPIIGEAVVEKEPNLISFIKEQRQKSLQFLYQRMEAAFGKRYPHAITDATLFIQALVKDLIKMNYSTQQKVSIETIVNSCFDKLYLCLEEMNNHPIFHSGLIYIDNSMTNAERFMNETLQLGQWLKKDFAKHPKKDLFIEYLNFLSLNRENLNQYPMMVNQIIQEFENELVGYYSNIDEYLQYLQNN